MTAFVFTILHVWPILVGIAVNGETLVNLTTTLGVVTGTVVADSSFFPNVHVFYGIPYATPPVGSLRFKPPERAKAWVGVRDATQMPNSCWQAIDVSFGRPRRVDLWNPNTNMSEDCLYLNVWIPDTATSKAVMVWIYGGGFWSGTSTLSFYNALKLANRNDIVVASFNYRVGPFGFLYSGTSDSPGNVGLLDQVMALKWLKDNAVNLGADPSRITIFGESAGAVSAGFHLMSPLSMDLFTYAILMSASPTVYWGIQSHDLALNRTQTLACLLGCRARHISETVSFLRALSPQLLADTQWNMTNFYFELPFAPVVDGYFLPKHPKELMDEGKIKNTSIIAGVVKDEGTFWLLYGFQDIYGKREDPRPLSPSEYTTVVNDVLRSLGPNFALDTVKNFTIKEYYDAIPPWSRSYLDSTDDISGDTLFKCPLITFSEFYSTRVKGHVYMYSFEHRVSTNTWPQWLGVAHGYEIEIFFGLPWLEDNYTDAERAFSDDVMARISNFAYTGNPNKGPKKLSVPWTEYTYHNQHYLIMNAGNMHVSQGLRFSQCQFWKTQVPLLQQQAAAYAKMPCADSGETLTPWASLLSLLAALHVVVAFTDCCTL